MATAHRAEFDERRLPAWASSSFLLVAIVLSLVGEPLGIPAHVTLVTIVGTVLVVEGALWWVSRGH